MPSFWTNNYQKHKKQTLLTLLHSAVNIKPVDEPCTLQPGYTWSKFNSSIFIVRGKDHDCPAWHYVLLPAGEEDTKQKFLAQVATGSIDVADLDYGQVLKSGWGVAPPSEVIDKIEKEYLISENCWMFGQEYIGLVYVKYVNYDVSIAIYFLQLWVIYEVI